MTTDSIFDNALFLVEVKAGTLSDPSKRGAPSRIKKELKKLVENAYEQALRAKQYILSKNEVSFTLPDASEVSIKHEQYKHIFLLNHNLEHLEAFITNISNLRDLGLFSSGEYPWTCSLSDLRIISETIEFPAQFVHYLKRRERINELEIINANDELDWWGNYLKEGLYFDNLLKEEELHFINLLSFTSEFDDYYFYKTGQRTLAASPPRQFIPIVIREVISELETFLNEGEIDGGYLDIVCLLLDLSGEERDNFSKNAMSRRAKAVESNQLCDFTMVLNDTMKSGITFLFSPTDDLGALNERLQGYCFTKKYQYQSEFWVGLACIAQSDGWIHLFCVLDMPWTFDEKMEKVVENLKNAVRKARGA